MNYLFLCTELAGYFVNCIQQLHAQHNCHITVVHYSVNKDAPFEFNTRDLHMIPKDSLSRNELNQLCLDLNPAITYIGGWVNKDYVRIAKRLRKNGSIVIAGMDNIWLGTIRQRLACIGAKYFIKPVFNFIWVAGRKQNEYARHLGFSSSEILYGLYTADVERFARIANFPMEKKLVFVGRFEEIKGIRSLIEAFKSIPDAKRSGWKLQMIGNGSLRSEINTSSNIEVHDFMQPEELISFVAHVGGFILPSLYEPWGVVVQEFAAAGKPLLLSDAVNSGEKYLVPNYNGFQFKNNDVDDLRDTLISFFELSDEKRSLMGKHSYELAMQGDPKMWASTFVSVLHLNHDEEFTGIEIKS